LHLPNDSIKQQIRVEVLSVLSPPEQWTGQRDVIRSHKEQTAATVHVLSQMQLTSGAISIKGDVTRREVPFEKRDFREINWSDFTAALQSTDTETVSAETLQGNKKAGAFFRTSLGEELTTTGEEAMRVVIIVSSRIMFERGSDLQPVKIQGDCRCRVYHLRFRHNIRDVFDDIEKLVKPLRPKTFNLDTSRDLRKALGVIIKDLEAL
jgi:hypothetical protein